MVILTSRSPGETERLGETWAREAKPGWVVGLTGELGAGKTQLVKGFARGLGIDTRVHSPTFTLVNEYAGGRLPLFHLDLYRLDSPDQVVSSGLEEYLFSPPGVALVEWIERWLGTDDLKGGERQASARLPRLLRQVWIESIGEHERRVRYEDFGA